MTYCVGLLLDRGLVMMADTRTQAGVDNISCYRKIFHWSVAGDRQIYLLTSGNLATSQAVVSILKDDHKSAGERDPEILRTPSIYQTARLVGKTLRKGIEEHKSDGNADAESTFDATLILAGQVSGGKVRLFLIYPEGNFIEASEDRPFFQIGEMKYGKPLLVRAFHSDMSFADAIKMLLVSFDSTVTANVSVGPPFDVMIYEADSLASGYEKRIEADDPYYAGLSTRWGGALLDAFKRLPAYPME